MNYAPICVGLFAIVSCVGCESNNTANMNSGDPASLPPLKSLDFDALRSTINAAVGQPEGTTDLPVIRTVFYFYDGTFEAIVNIVEPIAAAAGFSELTQPTNLEALDDAEQKAYAQGVPVYTRDMKIYDHPNGDRLLVMKNWLGAKRLGQTTEVRTLVLSLSHPRLMAVEQESVEPK